ncbi:MAG TPA: hypothetical protein VFT96_11185 [Gemmatimonadaceae bacterium]|nr:hypothetical protein [Gemmatimonadaceae bacterium]
MIFTQPNPAAELDAAVKEYRIHNNIGDLIDRLRHLAATSDPDALGAATAQYRDMPEVMIPVYEHIVAVKPGDAQAHVLLANAYWLTGRGSEAVDRLASRAREIDPGNRGAWHLWALSESEIRGRIARWLEVIRQFPGDSLARAAMADNAVSLAGAEHDPQALDLAIATYQQLLDEAPDAAHRTALQETLTKLRGWKL